MITQVPPPIVRVRKSICENCTCKVNFEDACESCPHKKWGPTLCPPSLEELNEESSIQAQHNLPFPALPYMVRNLASAVKSEVQSRISGENQLDLEEIKRRYALCEGCEFFHAPSKRCKKCGCFMKWKTAWRSQKCPIGKW